jgi:hypothetical protein
LTRHHPHPSHLPVFPVRLLKFVLPRIARTQADDLPFHHLFSTSHFAALVPSFVNWSDLAALGQRSRLPWGRSRFANSDSSAIHNDLRRHICHCLCSDTSDHCMDGLFLCRSIPVRRRNPLPIGYSVVGEGTEGGGGVLRIFFRNHRLRPRPVCK